MLGGALTVLRRPGIARVIRRAVKKMGRDIAQVVLFKCVQAQQRQPDLPVQANAFAHRYVLAQRLAHQRMDKGIRAGPVFDGPDYSGGFRLEITLKN
jgi:hypothetical protein